MGKSTLALIVGGALQVYGASDGAASAEAKPSGADFFQQKVYPLLESKCFGCHGEPKDREAEFDMRTRESLLKGGESGQPAFVPGDPEHSRIYQAVLRQGKLKMPPKERNKLDEAEIQVLREWIAGGAVWAEAKAGKPKWEFKPEDIWAFQPLRKEDGRWEMVDDRKQRKEGRRKKEERLDKVSDPPSSDFGAAGKVTDKGEGGRGNEIDRFIQEKLKEKGLAQAQAADRVTLLRRATFDLIGLAPTPEEIDAFVKDKSGGAFEKVVERLLASPRYGEQWGRHWLDVVRYADTDGFSNDYERPNAWRYRDYVIRSFNSDKPYNEFLMEQVAGDEMDGKDPEKLIATGMLRMGPWEHTAMSVAAVTRQLFLDDVTHNVGATFLGLTVGCARCHDHKFDPIPTKEYYRLQSVYAPVQFEVRKVPFLETENTADLSGEIARVRLTITNLQARLQEIIKKHNRAVNAYVKEKGYANFKAMPEALRPPRELGLTATDQSTEKVLRKRIEYCERELRRYEPEAFSVSSGGLEKPVPTPVLNILVGGSLEAPGEAVTPGVLTAVVNRGRLDYASEAKLIPQTDAGRRLALAKWMSSPENPLTARVMVNRIWQWHFGQGLVGTPNNFGKMGKKPAHPELLDWLAQYFIEHGWSVKAMHRLIMSSATYQQSATHPDMKAVKEADPEEKLWSHFLPRRLTAEELRDSMLQVAGELSTTMGGPPVYPEINMEAALQPRHIMGSLAPPYKPSATREQRNRRTVYTVQIRTLMNPLLQVFNEPSTDLSCERRDSTTVTPQVFALFNSQSAHDAALAMAERVRKELNELNGLNKLNGLNGQIEMVFRLAYGRKPTGGEEKMCENHLTKMIEHHRGVKAGRFELPKKVVQPMIEEFTGDPFEFEEEWDVAGYEYNLQPADVGVETRALADLCLVLLNSNEFVYIY